MYNLEVPFKTSTPLYFGGKYHISALLSVFKSN